MGRLRTGLRNRRDAARDALAEPNLRRLNLAYLCSQLGGWAYFVAISVYAFDHGGARAVGLMTVLRLTPALLAAPFAGALADRFPRRPVMIVADLGRAAAQTAAAILVISAAPPLTVYLAIAGSGLAGCAFEPAKAALLPALAQTPQQLTAANALGATIESIGITVGPALGGLLLGISSVQVVLLTFAAASVVSAALVSRIDGEPGRNREQRERGGVLRRSLAGFETIARDHALRTVVGVFAVQMLAFGLLNVFVVDIALQELRIGASGTGWLLTAAGVGGIAGGVATVSLAGQRLAASLGLGMALIAGGYFLLAAFASVPVALAAILLTNLGGCYVDVATFTLLQRAVDESVLARAFSVIGTIIVGALLLGGVIAPLLIAATGLSRALALSGATVLGCIALALPALRRIDSAAPRPLDGLMLLRGVSLFSVLSVPVLERLAGELQDQRNAAGDAIVTQGDPGDSYFIIAQGTAEVFVDDRSITVLGPGDAFGEIALLLDRPRTATIVARDDIHLGRLDRDVFLMVVVGDDEVRRAGTDIANGLLARARPSTMTF